MKRTIYGLNMKRIWEKEKKNVGICIVLLALIFFPFSIVKQSLIEKNDLKHLLADDYSFCYQIEAVNMGDNRIEISGWAFELFQHSSFDDFGVCLYDSEKNKVIRLKNKEFIRKDVNNYFSDDFDYSQSGFCAYVDVEELNLGQKEYEVLFAFDEYKKIYRLGVFLSESGLIDKTAEKETLYGNEAFQARGKLIVSNDDKGFYIVQDSGKLYLILNENYKNRDTEKMYISVHLITNQLDRLPENMQKLELNFDNRDFLFCNNQIEISNSEYCVAEIDLEAKYSITSIQIGEYVLDSGAWNWVNQIRPNFMSNGEKIILK